jgi:hypothetical protein
MLICDSAGSINTQQSILRTGDAPRTDGYMLAMNFSANGSIVAYLVIRCGEKNLIWPQLQMECVIHSVFRNSVQ